MSHDKSMLIFHKLSESVRKRHIFILKDKNTTHTHTLQTTTQKTLPPTHHKIANLLLRREHFVLSLCCYEREPNKRKDRTFHRDNTTTCTTHHYTQTSTARAGALIWSHPGDWITSQWVLAGHTRYIGADTTEGRGCRARDTGHRHTNCEHAPTQAWSRSEGARHRSMAAEPSYELRQ